MSQGLILIAISVGGALGTLTRYGAQRLIQRWARGDTFYSTLAVNLLACGLLGALVSRLPSVAGSTELSAPLLIIGYCGSLSTFSAFSLDNVLLAVERRWASLACNVLVSVTVGVSVTFITLAALG